MASEIKAAANYDALDQAILEAIGAQKAPLKNAQVCDLATAIATGTRREPFRVVDGRLQALRQAGKIEYQRAPSARWVLMAEGS